MKKFFLLLALLFCTSEAWAACGGTCYAKTAGGSWSAAGTWSATSSAGVDSVGPPAATDDVILNAGSGNVTIDATAVGKTLNCTGYTGTLTHNTGITLTLSGSATFVSGMTYTPTATSVLSFNATATLTTGTKLMPLVNFTGTTLTIGDNLTFMDSKVITLTNSGSGSMNLNGFTVSGFSSTSRVLIRTGTLGTARTITNTTGTFANSDFRDITFSTNADYSAITGLSGDCGGNSGATLTTGTTQTYTGGTGSWSDVTKWTSRVPLPQDDVSMSGVTGGTITADMPRLGKSIDWTGASGSPTFTNSVSVTNYGSLTFISGMTFTHTGGSWVFEGRSTYTLTSAGKNFGSSSVQMNMFGGTLTMQDAFSTTGSMTFTLNNGTLNANGFNMSFSNIFNSSATTTRVLQLGSGTWTFSGTGTVWNTGTSTSMTLTPGSSTILFSDTSASSKTFAGGGLTYKDLKIAGGGAGAVILTGANTFNRIYTDGGGTKSITLPGSTTTTIISGDGLGNGTNVITFTASSGSATVAKSGGGRVGWDYVSLTNIPASTANTWYAGPSTHSTDGGGNTNWIFSDAPNDSILMFSYPFSSRRFNSNR